MCTNNVDNFALAAHSQSLVLINLVVTPNLMLLGIAMVSAMHRQCCSVDGMLVGMDYRYKLVLRPFANVLCIASQQFLGLTSTNCQLHRYSG